MNEFLTVVGGVLPVFCVIAAGFGLRRFNWLTAEADRSLLNVTLNLLMPCFILDSIMANAAVRVPGNLLLAPLVGFGTVLLGLMVALAVTRWTGLKDLRSCRTFAVATGLYNYGYLPLPLALFLFSHETVGVLFVHNVGVEISVWTIALVLLPGADARVPWRKLLNAPLLSILIAVILNLAHVHSHLPRFLLAALNMLGQCAIPMALVLSGAVIADHLHEFNVAHGWRVIAWACVLRLGVLPICFLLLARSLPCSTELKQVIVLEAAMPSAVFPLVMARQFGGDPITALRVLVSTTVMALVTIPLWLRFGMNFVGL